MLSAGVGRKPAKRKPPASGPWATAPATLSAASALLAYAEHTQGRALTHVRSLQVARSDERIDLPPSTRRNLELVQTLRGESSPTLFSLLDTCASGMGSRALRQWLLEPRRDRGQARARLAAIADPAPGAAAKLADNGDFIMTMGCGDIYRMVPALLEALEN